ncbi:MAG TPA: SMP-30/gluconolactonase/LRE family protein [Acidimicrobiales bacterium]|nr:SMP-30/gluconolactonase/LRE family protein [Acidimicrobiales bacterium]
MPDTRTVEPVNLRVVTTGLRFPEGPIALADGSVLLVEIAGGALTRVDPDGTTTVVADCGGGPNGAAFGPDGAVYVANNGGCFDWHERFGLTFPGSPPPATYPGHGSLQRVDLARGEVTTLATECDGRPLRAPNDLVLDADGGIWFTDHGVQMERSADRTGFYYAPPGGGAVREVVAPLDSPNGIGLSPAGDRVYVAETHTGRLWGWDVAGPGEVTGAGLAGPGGGELVGHPGGGALFDSLAVDGEGWICVATLGTAPGITAFSPDGSQVEHTPLADPLTTNICFAADGTAFVTLSGTGQLVALDWPRSPGRLAFGA